MLDLPLHPVELRMMANSLARAERCRLKMNMGKCNYCSLPATWELRTSTYGKPWRVGGCDKHHVRFVP